jgi:hypothetical protein
MSEAEEAWRLWHLLQTFSDTLWQHYESAFMDFCDQEQRENCYYDSTSDSNSGDELPF